MSAKPVIQQVKLQRLSVKRNLCPWSSMLSVKVSVKLVLIRKSYPELSRWSSSRMDACMSMRTRSPTRLNTSKFLVQEQLLPRIIWFCRGPRNPTTIYRMQEDKQFMEARPSYRLTHQEDIFNALVKAVDDITDKTEEIGRLESWGSLRSQENQES